MKRLPNRQRDRAGTCDPAWLLVLLPLLMWLILAFALPAHATPNRMFSDIAGEILEGLDATDVAQIPAATGYGAPRIAVRPFKAARHGVSLDEANGYNRKLLAALQRQGRQRFRFVARDAFEQLMQEIKDSGGADANDQLDDLRASFRADILVIGRLTRERGETLLSYQVISADNGELFVNTLPRPVATTLSERPLRLSAASAPDARETEHPGDEPYRRTVEEAEEMLAELGYFPGAIDGILTEKTRQALRAYQADSALPINGRMTRRVVENMRRDTRLPY